MISKLIRRIGLILFCCMVFAMPVRAEEENPSVKLKNSSDGVEVVLSKDGGGEPSLYSLHLNFEIAALKGELNTSEVSFVPNGDIQKYVYISEPILQKDGSNIMIDIYASSKQNLLKNGDLVLGAVKLTPQNGSVTADVKIGRLETVNETQKMSGNEGTQFKPAQVTVGKDDPKPEEPDDNNSQEPGDDDNEEDQKPGGDDNGEDQKPGGDDNGEDQKPGQDDGGKDQKPGEESGGNDRHPEESSGSSNNTNHSNNNQPAKNADNADNNMPDLVVNNMPQPIIIETPPVQESSAIQNENSKPSASLNTQKEKVTSSQPVAGSEIIGEEVAEPDISEPEIETDTESVSEDESEPVANSSNIGESIQVIEEQEPSGMGLGIKILIGVIIGVVLLAGVVLAVRSSKK